MDDQQQSRWQLTRRRVLWASAAVTLLTVAILIGYRYGITLWDWIKLLIVPAVIASGGLWFNRQQQQRELALAEHRAQDEALQAYLDGMAQLLTDKERPLHRAQLGDNLSTVARARTLTVLPRLDGSHKRSAVTFLYEAGLIGRASTGASRTIQAIVSLAEADLSGIQLGTEVARYMTTNPGFAKAFQKVSEEVRSTSGAQQLNGANLSAVDLRHAHMDSTALIGADLSRAKLAYADLSDADLSDADLSDANLFYADLRRANLRGANLRGAELIYEEDLERHAKSLEGATMPNGQKYEDWLRDRGEGE